MKRLLIWLILFLSTTKLLEGVNNSGGVKEEVNGPDKEWKKTREGEDNKRKEIRPFLLPTHTLALMTVFLDFVARRL